MIKTKETLSPYHGIKQTFIIKPLGTTSFITYVNTTYKQIPYTLLSLSTALIHMGAEAAAAREKKGNKQNCNPILDVYSLTLASNS